MITEKRIKRILQDLKSISPQWANHLLLGHTQVDIINSNSKLSIHSGVSCIVGESNNFSASYLDTCERCDHFSRLVMYVAFPREIQSYDTSKYEIDIRHKHHDHAWNNLDKFIKHFKRCHQK